MTEINPRTGKPASPVADADGVGVGGDVFVNR